MDPALDPKYRQQKATPADAVLPFLPPDRTCNARLHRGSGYCENQAGADTEHPGLGRCRLHGGASPKMDRPDGPRDLFRAAGLDVIINLAEVMTHDDQEYLEEVATNALVVTKAGITARMQDPLTSPKEMADLTMSLTRIDTVLRKSLNDEDPDAGSNTVSGLDAELARLAVLEAE